MLLGYFAETEFSDAFWDKAERIPGALIIQREIKKAVKGENFFINDEKTGKPIRIPGTKMEEFFYYYRIWEDFHYFGLPHGRGSASERRWLLDFIKIFQKCFIQYENFIDQMESEKLKAKHGNH